MPLPSEFRKVSLLMLTFSQVSKYSTALGSLLAMFVLQGVVLWMDEEGSGEFVKVGSLQSHVHPSTGTWPTTIPA